jgi:hypothetical protein
MKLFYRAINVYSRPQAPIIAPIFNKLESGGRFYCNLSRAFTPEVYIPRTGVWSEPWNTDLAQEFQMPSITKEFNLTFSEVTNNRAKEVGKIIETTDKDCIVFYSGGIDSTVVLAALIQNLSPQLLRKVKLCVSAETLIENPYFYLKYIKNKFNLIDSTKNLYSDVLELSDSFSISSDIGDFIYGTEIGVKLYPQIRFLKNNFSSLYSSRLEELSKCVSSNSIHFSEFKELLIYFFNISLEKGIRNLKNSVHLSKELSTFNDDDRNFGELFYKKLVKNIESCQAPVVSLHDFFWWSMFNQRFIWGVIRPGFTYSYSENLKQILNGGILSWFAGEEYQMWSLNNNNNGEKFHGITQSSYKWASRNYIYDFDKNDWYRENKIKMPSLPLLLKTNYKKTYDQIGKRFGVKNDYNVIKVDDPGVNDYIREGIVNFKIDWY